MTFDLARAVRRLSALPPSGVKTYVRQVPQPFRAGQPISTDWSFDRAARSGYDACAWVDRCLSMIMENGSTIPFGLQGRGSDGKWSFDWAAPLSGVLANWNDDFGAQENLARELAYLCLGGNALAGILPEARFRRSMKDIRELVAESPAGVSPEPNDIGGIGRYQHSDPNAAFAFWDSADMVHGRLPDPRNPFWGRSKLRAIATAVVTDGLAADAYRERLENGGAPVGLLMDTTLAGPTDRAKAQKDWNKAWQQAKGPLLVGEGTQWFSLGMTMEELQWAQNRLWSMREIVIGFGFHPALFGEDSTYANSEAAEKGKWTGAILPLLNVIGGAMTRRLLSKQERQNFRIWYDVSQVQALQANLSAMVDMLVKLVASGCPYDTAKDTVGLPVPDLPGGQGKVPLMDSRLQMLKTMLEAEDLSAEVVGAAVEDTLADEEAETAAKARLILAGKWGR